MESSVICGICRNSFSNTEAITNHMTVHIKVRRCTVCDEYFPQFSSTYEHHCTKKHRNTQQPPFTNSVCPQSISGHLRKDKTHYQYDKSSDRDLQNFQIERRKEADVCNLKSDSDNNISQERTQIDHCVRNDSSKSQAYTELCELKRVQGDVKIKEKRFRKDVENKDEKESAVYADSFSSLFSTSLTVKDKNGKIEPDVRESRINHHGVHTGRNNKQIDQRTNEDHVENSDSNESDTSSRGKTGAEDATVNSSRNENDLIPDRKKCKKNCTSLGSSDENVEDEHSGDSEPAADKTEELSCQICGKDFDSSRARKVHQATHPGGFVSDCKVCGKHFKNGSNLQRHMRMHRGEKPFRCKVCGKRYADQKTVLIHERVHTGERPHRCDKCGKRFSNPKSYRYHMKQHVGKRISCETCRKTFASSANLSVHMKTHGSKEFLCDICDKGFYQLGNLRRHQKTHLNDGEETEMVMKLSLHDGIYTKSTHVCRKDRPLCQDSKTLESTTDRSEDKEVDRNVKTRSSTRTGQVARAVKQRQHKRTIRSTLLCGICDKSFMDYSSLRNHIELHITPKVTNCEKEKIELGMNMMKEGQIVPTFKCKMCGQKFKEQVFLRQHMSVHLKIRAKISEEFQSITCGKEIVEGRESKECENCMKDSYIDNGNIDKVAEENSDSGIIVGDASGNQSDNCKTSPETCRRKYKKALKNRICEICSKAYISVKRLKLHRQEHDSPPEAIHTCQSCGKSFTRLSGLTRHKKSHTKPAVFPCEYCQKEFSCKSKQEIHTRVHTGERPYKCGDCGKTFAAKSGYHQHRQLHELGKVQCQVCSKILTNNSYLRRHMRIHTKEKPYKCQVCGEAFYMYGTYRNHCMAHQGISPKVYTKKQPATCEVCGKYFLSKYYLISHMRLHTGEKPFVCDICGRGFVQGHGLHRHLLYHEKEKNRPEKKFQCEVCHNFYPDLKNLQRHMIYHNRERNCKCQLCHKSYIRPSHLKRHMTETHKMNLKTSMKPTSMCQPRASVSQTQIQSPSHSPLPLIEPVSVPTFVAPAAAGSSSIQQDLVPVPPDPVAPVPPVPHHQPYLQNNDNLHIHTMEAAMFNYVSQPHGGELMF